MRWSGGCVKGWSWLIVRRLSCGFSARVWFFRGRKCVSVLVGGWTSLSGLSALSRLRWRLLIVSTQRAQSSLGLCRLLSWFSTSFGWTSPTSLWLTSPYREPAKFWNVLWEFFLPRKTHEADEWRTFQAADLNQSQANQPSAQQPFSSRSVLAVSSWSS